MLKKEIMDTLKALLHSSLFLIVIPVSLLLKAPVSKSLFVMFIVLLALYAGATLFQAERRDRALEYLLSLPISRWRILAFKVLPRLALLVAVTLLGALFSLIDSFFIDMTGIFLTFLLAVSISLAVESVFLAMTGALMLNYILHYTTIIISYLVMRGGPAGPRPAPVFLSSAIPLLLLVVPMVAAFVLVFKTLDLKPLKLRSRPYLVIAMPAILLLACFILMYYKQYAAWIKIIG
ncbi:MAG: ABC transporter permease subunit [bacterium]|nr:ABC transporter permease subunit [bacterium]